MILPVSIRSFLLGPCILLAAACTAPRPNPYVVIPSPGETLTSISGPMPDFDSYTSVSDALLAACPVIVRQPHALIPVPRNDQNFSVYCEIVYVAILQNPSTAVVRTPPLIQG